MDNKILASYIWSETLGCMVVKGFTTRAVLIKKNGSKPYKVCQPYHWTWNEEDALYYRDDVDDAWTEDIPENGAKGFTLKLGYRRRTLVTLD